jgi:hypothetical protein
VHSLKSRCPARVGNVAQARPSLDPLSPSPAGHGRLAPSLQFNANALHQAVVELAPPNRSPGGAAITPDAYVWQRKHALCVELAATVREMAARLPAGGAEPGTEGLQAERARAAEALQTEVRRARREHAEQAEALDARAAQAEAARAGAELALAELSARYEALVATTGRVQSKYDRLVARSVDVTRELEAQLAAKDELIRRLRETRQPQQTAVCSA